MDEGMDTMSDQGVFSTLVRITGYEAPDFKSQPLSVATKTLAKDFSYGFVGLFVLDVSWRVMDVMIDFICNHVHWLAWLGNN